MSALSQSQPTPSDRNVRSSESDTGTVQQMDTMECSGSQNLSRSPSPETSDSLSSSALPAPVAEFFSLVVHDGFPKPKDTKPKQPWKEAWEGLQVGGQQPAKDGKLIVACPKICTYGSNNLGGL